MKFNRLQQLISALPTQIAVIFRAAMFVAPNPRQVEMVVSGILVLVNPAARTVIAEEKVNAAAYTIHVLHMAVVNVNQVMIVILICIVVSTDISRTIMCVDIAASERHAIAI